MEDETDFFRAETSLATGGNSGDRFIVEAINAGSGGVEKTNQIQKSRFSATGRAHDHDKLAAFHG